MDLTGKCKEDFLNSIPITEEMLLCAYTEREITSLIIEFFDSVGIIITISEDSFNHVDEDNNEDYWCSEFSYDVKRYTEIENGLNDYSQYYNSESFKNRKEATIQAIKKANEIYNNLFLPK